MDKIPNNNQKGGFWWLFKSKPNSTEVSLQTTLETGIQNKTKTTSETGIKSKPNSTKVSIQNKTKTTSETGIESTPWWKFWDSDSDEEIKNVNKLISKSLEKSKQSNTPIMSKQSNMSKQSFTPITLKQSITPIMSKQSITTSVSKLEKQNSTSVEKSKESICIPSKLGDPISSINLNIKINQIENKSKNIKENESKEIAKSNENVIIENKKLLNFLSNMCIYKLKNSVFNNLNNLINSNIKLYEENPVKLVILKYRLCNNISNLEKIENLFFDIGFNETILDTELNNFKKDNIIENNLIQKREVIVINDNIDINLKDIIVKVKNFEKDDNLYFNVIKLISSYMGEECDDYKFNKFITNHSAKYNTNFINIGDIDCGLDRHKSLLFKYLCDILNLNCSLFRNIKTDSNNYIYDDHIWNLILINGKIYVVDFKYFPNKIVYPNNIDTSKYYKVHRFEL